MSAYHGSTDPVGAAASGRCPRCGQGALFEGWLKVKPSCLACGLDLGFADSGDGPAFFLTLLGGVVAVLVAGICIALGLPAGAVALVSILATFGAMLAALRPAKGLMIGLQYKYNAGEGRSS
ncbi:DUF983 domain-containing protein [Parvularcula maris]|uniref:DUF983 domain-containing protein n=1 Tax=Parvularcula maris TaxID=2965077 RepID=A0A9X2L8C0_9PROT|nr:DUF983 domain-containing protein [Parvularcula maris]